jgi:GT2 family glycosyltransferase
MNDMANNPLVSIIVRTKDRPKLLKRAIQSISAQTYRPIEVVLVNDGGCDLDVGELKDILRDISLNYMRLEKNTGRSHAGNVGLENAKGEYIGFLDDDDEFYPEHLKVLATKRMNSSLRIAYTDAEVVFVDIVGEDKIVEKFKYVFYSQEFSPDMLLIQNYIPFICLLFHRSVFDDVRFDESFEIFEDWKILIRLSQKYWFEHIKKVTARYIQWCSKSQINRRALLETFSQVAYKRVLDENINKITPTAIYIHCVNSATERMRLINELIKAESDASLERMEFIKKLEWIEAEKQEIEVEKQQIEYEKQQIRNEKQKIERELKKAGSDTSLERMEFMKRLKWTEGEKQQTENEKQKIEYELKKAGSDTSLERMEFMKRLKWIEVEKHQIEYEKQKIEAEKHQVEHERDRLIHELMSLQKELSNSLSWNLIEQYRRFKDKFAPIGSRRRVLYEMFLKSIKVMQQEGMKGLSLRAKRRLRFNPDYLKFKSRVKRPESVSFTMESRISEVHGFIKKPVHIIMPVYNGYECLRDCIGSIFRNTDIATHTLVIIDDKSTDQRVAVYLQKLKEKRDGKRIEILFNSDNQGFVKTINMGMKLSSGDVIILNSDTLVTKNWVDKLQRTAYSKPRIATATPLSNYVTINGIPKPFQYNTIPCGMDVEAFAEFLEMISLRCYPEIPAGVGFCMYIKRDILEELGYFDETKFEKGYAEETDFCMRALKRGFVHVLDDSTYIYHIGGISFESVNNPEIIKEKNLMIERNLETLKSLHPEYSILVEKALHENLAPVHEYIKLRLELMEKKIESTLFDRPKT